MTDREETAAQEEETTSEETETSLDEILAKKAEEGAAADDEPEEAMIAPGTSDRVEALPAKVVPQQPTEFVCKKCFLVKHRSQLADKKRMICRDCA